MEQQPVMAVKTQKHAAEGPENCFPLHVPQQICARKKRQHMGKVLMLPHHGCSSSQAARHADVPTAHPIPSILHLLFPTLQVGPKPPALLTCWVLGLRPGPPAPGSALQAAAPAEGPDVHHHTAIWLHLHFLQLAKSSSVFLALPSAVCSARWAGLPQPLTIFWALLPDRFLTPLFPPSCHFVCPSLLYPDPQRPPYLIGRKRSDQPETCLQH